MAKTKFDRETWIIMLKEIANTAPIGQVNPELIKEMKEYLLDIDNKTDQQFYDYLATIANNNLASNFVKAVFAVERFYERPVDE